MASIFKTLTSNDVTSTKTLLHEAIPITGTIVSGTYADNNIKTYGHGMFVSVYDYPYLSSSANHIFDMSAGYSTHSEMSATHTGTNMQDKKINMYNMMAQVLVGFDMTGTLERFDQDGDIAAGGTKLDSCLFFNFARLLSKDEIQKGTVQLSFDTGGTYASPTQNVTLTDVGAATSSKVNSPAGEYGILYKDGSADLANALGLVYYQAGVVVLTSSLFDAATSMDPTNNDNMSDMMVSASIDTITQAVRHRTRNIQFNNTTELNSTVYFCRANNNDFNYSSNPTYVTGSKIMVKNVAADQPQTYPTTVGLYGADNELLAVAKLSEPIKKTPASELTLRVRLDY
jgi:hypothetical protein